MGVLNIAIGNWLQNSSIITPLALSFLGQRCDLGLLASGPKSGICRDGAGIKPRASEANAVFTPLALLSVSSTFKKKPKIVFQKMKIGSTPSCSIHLEGILTVPDDHPLRTEDYVGHIVVVVCHGQ